MARYKLLATLFLFLFPPTSALAGHGNGLVGHVYAHFGDQVFFNMQIEYADNCATTPSGRFRINLANIGGQPNKTGQAMYLMLMAAKERNIPIYVHGSGTCTGPREDVYFIRY